MANLVYNKGKALLANGGLDWDAATIKAALVGTAYTANADHNFLSEVTAELSGTGYVRKTLAGCTVTEDDTNDRAILDANDVTWTGINAGTAAAVVIYKDNASDAAAELICYVDVTDTVTNGGDFTVQWSTAGILTLN